MKIKDLLALIEAVIILDGDIPLIREMMDDVKVSIDKKSKMKHIQEYERLNKMYWELRDEYDK